MMNLYILLSYAAVSVLLWGALLVVQSFFRYRFGLDATLSTCLAVIAIGCIGYTALFAYLLSVHVGFLFSGACVAILVVQAYRQRCVIDDQLTPNGSLYPFAIAAMFGLIYLSCSQLYPDWVIENRPANLFFEKPRPHDYRIP